MIERDALKNIPQEGFIKFGYTDSPPLSPSQRTALVRRGNALFNAGEIEKAKRVFLTTRYGDGLGRVGDYYFEHNQPLEALRMYWLAPAPDKVEILIEKVTSVVHSWLQEEEGTDETNGS